jgi:hypothetical protein
VREEGWRQRSHRSASTALATAAPIARADPFASLAPSTVRLELKSVEREAELRRRRIGAVLGVLGVCICAGLGTLGALKAPKAAIDGERLAALERESDPPTPDAVQVFASAPAREDAPPSENLQAHAAEAVVDDALRSPPSPELRRDDGDLDLLPAEAMELAAADMRALQPRTPEDVGEALQPQRVSGGASVADPLGAVSRMAVGKKRFALRARQPEARLGAEPRTAAEAAVLGLASRKKDDQGAPVLETPVLPAAEPGPAELVAVLASASTPEPQPEPEPALLEASAGQADIPPARVETEAVWPAAFEVVTQSEDRAARRDAVFEEPIVLREELAPPEARREETTALSRDVETAFSPPQPRLSPGEEISALLASLGYLRSGSGLAAAATAFAEDHRLADAHLDAALLAALRAADAGEFAPPTRRRESRSMRVARVREAQMMLVFLGYEVYEIDGSVNGETRDALDHFAADAALADANVDPALLALLRETRGLEN